mmetsp:Transcript_5440/g.9836  ORF Transcript_5440/g.9836 Transcript_5440/m.9836 type:complete len:224 (-) Transcript_5440:2732-3403(-)
MMRLILWISWSGDIGPMTSLISGCCVLGVSSGLSRWDVLSPSNEIAALTPRMWIPSTGYLLPLPSSVSAAPPTRTWLISMDPTAPCKLHLPIVPLSSSCKVATVGAHDDLSGVEPLGEGDSMPWLLPWSNENPRFVSVAPAIAVESSSSDWLSPPRPKVESSWKSAINFWCPLYMRSMNSCFLRKLLCCSCTSRFISSARAISSLARATWILTCSCRSLMRFL